MTAGSPKRITGRRFPRPKITALECRSVKRLGLGRGSLARYWYATIAIGSHAYRIHISANVANWLRRASAPESAPSGSASK